MAQLRSEETGRPQRAAEGDEAMGLNILHLRATFSRVVAMVAIVVFTGTLVSTAGAVSFGEPFDSFTDKGVLRLQLGPTNFVEAATDGTPENHISVPVPRIVYETQRPFPESPRDIFAQAADQLFVLSGKCGGALEASPELATLHARGGAFSLGFGPDSLGVYDGPKGVACYRISVGEAVVFQLGSDLKKDQGAWSFYRLEIDIEVKQNALFELQILRGGVPVGAPWVLESGSSVTHPTNTSLGDNPFACTARSDSAPDAGAADNCRWVINLDGNTVGDGFTLKAMAGEGSLEGGGDWGAAAYVNNTIIYLTDVKVGVLGCNADPGYAGTVGSAYTGTIGDGESSAQCAVTRVDPTEVVEQSPYTCSSNIPYLFRTIPTGVGGCELRKDEDDTIAAVLDVVFPEEPRTELDAVPPTMILFPGASDEWPMPLCKGTLVMDANGDSVRADRDPRPDDVGLDLVSPDPTIVEVLTDPESIGVTDVVPGTPSLEWACVLEHQVDYVGGSQMQVRQRILFWGDPVITRF